MTHCLRVSLPTEGMDNFVEGHHPTRSSYHSLAWMKNHIHNIFGPARHYCIIDIISPFPTESLYGIGTYGSHMGNRAPMNIHLGHYTMLGGMMNESPLMGTVTLVSLCIKFLSFIRAIIIVIGVSWPCCHYEAWGQR